MTETDPQQAARDRLFALIASIPGSGGVDWCGKARALLNEIAAAPAAAPSAPVDRAAGPAALREAAAFYESVLQESLDPDSDPRYCTAVRDVVMGLRRRADEAQQAPTDEDVVEAHRLALSFALDLGTGAPWDAIHDRTAELSPAERTMLNYALNQAQLRMWATGGFTDEDQAAVVSLCRVADEAQQPEADGADQCSGCRYVPCGNCPPAAGAQQPKEA